ncbi:LysR family transcriptional regulator [Aromatoleum petrolei]|uniref:LysR family transcriptional regulator n=1 Tax=Aromatoleum petrolei TaxID=76116 RepID=A0ABX1MXP1_9RHOO|nr:LysR family transcriptional regulator [Aromatoleum petrolei]NMF91110.1 LysR family transcriptional regulator [Aromatoleum petrolei]QTQ36326.1 Transcriptional regulator, LysR family [Aromatoleum petrolei]
MNATFRQLRLFLALADHGSVTAAAEACHVTQPTVSMQLRELADAVGLPLYEQVGKRLYLTAAGEALAETARAMLNEWLAFGQAIDAMKGLERGRLRVALVSTAKYFVPRLLGSFCAEHPNIEIALEVLNRDGVVARLRENRDDLYIMSMPPENLDLERHAFLPNPLVVIAPEGHPLAGRRIELIDLAGERFILRERGSGTRLACDAHFARNAFVPRVRLELGSNEAIKQAVAGGLGLAVISRHALAARPGDDQLAVLDVAGFPVQSSWFTLHPRGKRLSPVATVFLGHLERTAREWSERRDRH